MDKEWNCQASRLFNGTIVITDPCYLCESGAVDAQIERSGLVSSTYYGDWGCTLFRAGEEVGEVRRGAERLGRFTADAGMVCVVTLDVAKAMRPDFEEWLKDRPWCATVVRDFDGEVRLMTRQETETWDDDREYTFTELRVRGDGVAGGEEIAFESVQTAL